MKILVLSVRYISLGYGVDLVINQLKKVWESLGIQVYIGAIDSDSFDNEKVFFTSRNIEGTLKLIENINPDMIFIHTYPFWEFIKEIKQKFNIPVFAHDHGDPTPELLPDKVSADYIREQYSIRRNIVEKYSDKVYCISDFIRHDVGYKTNTKIVYHGIEHIKDFGPKLNISRDKLKIGGLGRLGVGENSYKGISKFIELVKHLEHNKFEFYYCGHGTKKEVETLTNLGINISLNISNLERDNYLRSLDIFVSTSLWEGFNLPLAEAQATSTLAIAFDVGAHPEVTPYTFSSIQEMINFIKYLENDRKLLLEYSNYSYKFVKDKFNWINCGVKLLTGIDLDLTQPDKKIGVLKKIQVTYKKVSSLGFMKSMKIVLIKIYLRLKSMSQ